MLLMRFLKVNMAFISIIILLILVVSGSSGLRWN